MRIGHKFKLRFCKLPLAYVLALGACAPLAACVAVPPADAELEDVGSLGLQVQAAPGVTLDSVQYTITRGEFTKSGSIDTSGAPTVNATIGGLPEGNGYTITLTATSVEGGTEFTGSAKFDVIAGQTTSASVVLRGTGATNHGSVSVNGTLNVVPVIDELTVTPQSVYVGSSVSLKATGRDADEGPSALTYYWATTEGAIDDPLSPSPTLSSASPGTATVTLTVSDGDSSASVSTTVTFVERESEAGTDGGAAAGPEHPNVLLIVADDLGAESVSLFPELNGDSGAVSLPNIEKLADNGLVFENAWASPMCSPTRATIASGKYGHRSGVTTAGDTLPTSTTTVFDRITDESSADYGLALFGKYHLAGNNSTGTDANLQHVRDLGIPVFRGYMGATINPFNWSASDINGPAVSLTAYATTVLTDYTIDHINQHESARPSDPWFVWLAHNAAHQSSNRVPPPHLHSINLGNLQEGQLSNTVPVHKAILQSLDTEIGRLLTEVDLEKTTVIFIGDNGTFPSVKDSGSGVRGSKTSVYQGGVHVPLIIAGAGVTRRGREDALVTSTDLHATILSLAGIPVSQVENSYNLEPLLSDEAASSGRTHSFTELSNGTNNRRYALRDKRFKLVSNPGAAKELYDLVADPLETTNLFTNPAYAAVLASLQAEIAELRVEAPAYFP